MDTSRTLKLIGEQGINRLKNSSVAVFGLGGVGGHALESIARAGVGKILICDFDRVAPSNLNRQILSLESNIGELKTSIAEKRLKDINPDVIITSIAERLTEDNIDTYLNEDFDYAIDAIDEVIPKVCLLARLKERNKIFVSSMGAGSRLDPSLVKTDDISKTAGCPLARTVRKRLRQLDIHKGIPCVFSTESPVKYNDDNTENQGSTGNISYMPALFGLIASSYIIRKIIAAEQ